MKVYYLHNTEDVLTASVAKVKEAHILMDPAVLTNPLRITVSRSVVTLLCMDLLQ